jgi:hypothetical protein
VDIGHALRIDLRDMDLSNHLLRRMSSQGLRTLIKDEDVALHVGSDDSIHGAFDQVHEELVRLPELIFNPFSLGDIQVDPFITNDLPLLILDGMAS